MSDSHKDNIAIVALVAIALGSYYVGWPLLEEHLYRGALPSTIDVTDTVFIDSESHFREGCGLAVFRLAPTTLERIQTKGLAAFQNAKQSKNDEKQYGSWSETPYPVTGDGLSLDGRWLMGRICAKNIPAEITQALNYTMSNSEAYYSKTYEAGVFVVPKFNLILYMDFG